MPTGLVPLQGQTALTVAIISVTVTLFILIVNLLPERKRPTDRHDDH